MNKEQIENQQEIAFLLGVIAAKLSQLIVIQTEANRDKISPEAMKAIYELDVELLKVADLKK